MDHTAGPKIVAVVFLGEIQRHCGEVSNSGGLTILSSKYYQKAY